MSLTFLVVLPLVVALAVSIAMTKHRTIAISFFVFIMVVLSVNNQTHHREVVVGIGAIAMLLYLRLQGLNNLLGRVEVCVA